MNMRLAAVVLPLLLALSTGAIASTEATQVITDKTITTSFKDMSLDGTRHPMSWSETAQSLERINWGMSRQIARAMSFHDLAGRPDFDQGVLSHLFRRLTKETAGNSAPALEPGGNASRP
jgi:hypothetical protein